MWGSVLKGIARLASNQFLNDSDKVIDEFLDKLEALAKLTPNKYDDEFVEKARKMFGK